MRSRRRKRDAELNPDLDETRIYKSRQLHQSLQRKWGRFVGMVVLGAVFVLGRHGSRHVHLPMGYSRDIRYKNSLVSESTSDEHIGCRD